MRALLVLLFLALLPGAATAQQIRARVLNEQSRQQIRDARVTVVDSARAVIAEANTGSDGFFTIERLATGSYTLVVEYAGFVPFERAFDVTADSLVNLPAILLKSAAVVLDPVSAEVESRPDALAPVAQFVVAGRRMAQLERSNASASAVLREITPGVRINNDGRRICLESNRGPVSMNGAGPAGCNPVLVVVDDQISSNGPLILRGLKVGAYESIEYLTAIQASIRFGLLAGGAGGAIVLWTRGFGPHRSADRDPTIPPET